MGPRIREDDKIVNPSFPICFVIPPRALLFLASFCPRWEVFFKAPEHFFPMRGVLLRGAFGAKERHPRMFLSGTGIHLLTLSDVPPLPIEQRIAKAVVAC
jgi:hypothetical protein